MKYGHHHKEMKCDFAGCTNTTKTKCFYYRFNWSEESCGRACCADHQGRRDCIVKSRGRKKVTSTAHTQAYFEEATPCIDCYHAARNHCLCSSFTIMPILLGLIILGLIIALIFTNIRAKETDSE